MIRLIAAARRLTAGAETLSGGGPAFSLTAPPRLRRRGPGVEAMVDIESSVAEPQPLSRSRISFSSTPELFAIPPECVVFTSILQKGLVEGTLVFKSVFDCLGHICALFFADGPKDIQPARVDFLKWIAPLRCYYCFCDVLLKAVLIEKADIQDLGLDDCRSTHGTRSRADEKPEFIILDWTLVELLTCLLDHVQFGVNSKIAIRTFVVDRLSNRGVLALRYIAPLKGVKRRSIGLLGIGMDEPPQETTCNAIDKALIKSLHTEHIVPVFPELCPQAIQWRQCGAA
jgi:hypothetical protein